MATTRETTVKDKILQVLYNLDANLLSNKEIEFVRLYLPKEAPLEVGVEGVTTSSATDIDFSTVFTNHKSESFEESISFNKKDGKDLIRLIEDISDEKKDGETKSMLLEKLMAVLTPKQIVWLVNSGIERINENNVKKAILGMIMGSRKDKEGNDEDTPQFPDISGED